MTRSSDCFSVRAELLAMFVLRHVTRVPWPKFNTVDATVLFPDARLSRASDQATHRTAHQAPSKAFVYLARQLN